MPSLFAGLGCQRHCPASALAALLDTTLARHGLTRADLAGIGSIDLKADEPGLLQLASELGLTLVVFSAEQLAAFEGQLTHRSALAFAHTGCHGVAESTALAMAGKGATLRVTRQKNAQATLALAQPGKNPG
ncbi:cobalamin biosynthesis protein [Pseudomonas eucalypticola]|uniref:Cobalamin biosynthesis protein n=1 Tax=Pseudomonas eucalypticola TaxID=2599595 RepID=A0A7D5DAT3_9PSED|nr:cobalamin biosynthesis protein [Pseudomonas eucalypticola]QKZ05561.1 cobalamin biosynthesis protein [Pseudomonas eucalypticola]